MLQGTGSRQQGKHGMLSAVAGMNVHTHGMYAEKKAGKGTAEGRRRRRHGRREWQGKCVVVRKGIHSIKQRDIDWGKAR